MVAVSRIDHKAKAGGVRPAYAIVLYQESGGGRSSFVCATKHNIGKNNSLSIGQVISPNKIADLFSTLVSSDSASTSQCIPENVLFDSPSSIIWYKKRFISPMWFRVGQKPESLHVEWPPLLFVADKINRALYVFALGSNSRPTGNTRLYHAPLMNIDEEGFLCQGSAKLPNDITISTLHECESTLIDSQFTHINHDYTLKRTTGNKEHVEFWRTKARSGSDIPQRVRANELRFAKTLSTMLSKA